MKKKSIPFDKTVSPVILIDCYENRNMRMEKYLAKNIIITLVDKHIAHKKKLKIFESFRIIFTSSIHKLDQQFNFVLI